MVWMKPSPGKMFVLIVLLWSEINPSWFSLLLVKIIPKHLVKSLSILQVPLVLLGSTAPLTDDFCVLQNTNPPEIIWQLNFKLSSIYCVFVSPAVLWIAMVHVQVKLSYKPYFSVVVLITNLTVTHSIQSPPNPIALFLRSVVLSVASCVLYVLPDGFTVDWVQKRKLIQSTEFQSE